MKKTILFISPGHTYRPRSDIYQARFIELSKNFSGHIFTTAPVSEKLIIGDFVYTSLKSSNSKFKMIKFLFFCVWNALKLLMKREKVDLVISYDPLGTGLIGCVMARILGAKFASEVKGVYTSPYVWVDNVTPIEARIKKMIIPSIMRFVLKRADGITLLFKSQIDSFQKIIQGKMIHMFHSFVPTENFKNIREDKEVLFVGFPFKLKGVDILIEAFKKISPSYPEWKLKILGWYPNLEELNKAIDGHPRIYHHKAVQHQDMPEHIGSCAILVLPSRSEAMGRVLVEAMAAGKPRIGSDVDGIPTVINDGVDGLLFKPENVDDLAEKLSILMSDSNLRYKLGKSGEIRAKQEFTKEEYVKNLTNFYNAVLNGGVSQL